MKLTTEQITRLESLAKETGFSPDLFLDEAINDWFTACADTYRDHALKRRGVQIMPIRISAAG